MQNSSVRKVNASSVFLLLQLLVVIVVLTRLDFLKEKYAALLPIEETQVYIPGPLYVPDPVFLEKYARIQEELKGTTNPPWAGFYRNFNSTTERKVWIAPKNGWLESSRGCFGGWMRSGIVREGGGLIQLGPEVETMEADFGVLREVGVKSLLEFDDKPPSRKKWCLGTDTGLLLKFEEKEIPRVDVSSLID
jgi:hypothetical protein